MPGPRPIEAVTTMDSDPPETNSPPPSSRSGIGPVEPRAPQTPASKTVESRATRASDILPNRLQVALPLGSLSGPSAPRISASQVTASRAPNSVPRPGMPPRPAASAKPQPTRPLSLGVSAPTSAEQASHPAASGRADSSKSMGPTLASGLKPPTSQITVRPAPSAPGASLPEPTPPQGFALAAMAKTDAATQEPRPHAEPEQSKVARLSQPPSEHTRIFAPNLQDPQLKRSTAPKGAVNGAEPASPIPREPKLPSGLHVPPSEDASLLRDADSSPMQSSNRVPLEDQTRTYSAETIDRLLHGGESASDSETPQVPQQPEEERTRVYSRPPELLLDAARAQGTSASKAGTAADELTRVYDSPAQAWLQERDITSPGTRQKPELTIQIQGEPTRPGRKRYALLGLLIAVTAVGFTYREPISRRIASVSTLVLRGVDATEPGIVKPVPDSLINLSISVSPADARLSFDGTPVSNPFVGQRRPDKLPHELVAEAPGYLPLKRAIKLERDLTVMLGLTLMQQAPASGNTEVVPAPSEPQGHSPSAPVAAGDASDKVPSGSESDSSSRSAAKRHAASRVKATPSGGPASGSPASAGESQPSTGKSSPGCSPPFTIDGSGIKTYKPECI